MDITKIIAAVDAGVAVAVQGGVGGSAGPEISIVVKALPAALQALEASAGKPPWERAIEVGEAVGAAAIGSGLFGDVASTQHLSLGLKIAVAALRALET